MTCEEAQYLITEAEKGEYVKELLDEALEHTRNCKPCAAPFEELIRAGEAPVIIIPAKPNHERGDAG